MIGKHYLLDLYGIDCELAQDEDRIGEVLHEAARIARAQVLHVQLHGFGSGQGVTGMALLCESHISIHTWPEHAFAAIDLFMCGDTCPERAAEYLKQVFQAKKSNWKALDRG